MNLANYKTFGQGHKDVFVSFCQQKREILDSCSLRVCHVAPGEPKKQREKREIAEVVLNLIRRMRIEVSEKWSAWR